MVIVRLGHSLPAVPLALKWPASMVPLNVTASIRSQVPEMARLMPVCVMLSEQLNEFGPTAVNAVHGPFMSTCAPAGDAMHTPHKATSSPTLRRTADCPVAVPMRPPFSRSPGRHRLDAHSPRERADDRDRGGGESRTTFLIGVGWAHDPDRRGRSEYEDATGVSSLNPAPPTPKRRHSKVRSKTWSDYAVVKRRHTVRREGVARYPARLPLPQTPVGSRRAFGLARGGGRWCCFAGSDSRP